MGTSINQKYVNLLQSTFEKYKSLDSPSSVEPEDRDKRLKEIPLDNWKVKRKRRHQLDSQEGTTTHAVKDNAGKHDVSKLLKKSFKKYQNMEKESKKIVKKYLKSQDNSASGSDALVNRKKKVIVAACEGEEPPKTKESEDVLTNKSDWKVKRKRFTTKRTFSKEEDKIILEAIESAGISHSDKLPRGFVSDLGRKMNRNLYSVKERLSLLLTQKTRLYHVSFTLLDDKAIIEAAVENIRKVKKLSISTIENINEIATKLSRSKDSVAHRWLYTLKPWVMSYYAKTLNLDIRIMLANFVSENFNTIHDIDWELVLERPEFSGHTVGSIKHVFMKINHLAAYHLHKKMDEVSLTEIAEDASSANVRKMTEAIKRRQREIIEYFESVIKHNKIENFL